MTREELLPQLHEYATRVLQGVCRAAFQLGDFTSPTGEIFLRAKLAPSDLDELSYSDTYPAIRAVLWRWGEIRTDDAAQPFRVRFNFYDPRNEEIAFRPAVAPAAAAAAAPARRSARDGARSKPRRRGVR